VYILENPELGVCKEAQDRPAQKGRYLILIHVGNWVTDVIGCIAPGLSGGFMVNPKDKRMSKAVLGSAGAMQRLQTRLGRSEIHQLVIAPVLGAKGVI